MSYEKIMTEAKVLREAMRVWVLSHEYVKSYTALQQRLKLEAALFERLLEESKG